MTPATESESEIRPRAEPQDLSSLWTTHLRLSQTHPCPYCPHRQNFHQERRLLDHIHTAHPELLPVRDDAEAVASVRDDIRARSRGKDALPLDPARPRHGRFPVRPSSSGGLVNAADEPRSEEFRGQLLSSPAQQSRLVGLIEGPSLAQKQDAGGVNPYAVAQAQAQLSPLGPRKRAAAPDAGPVETSGQPRLAGAQLASHPRRSKARSVLSHPKVNAAPENADPDFRRTAVKPEHVPRVMQSPPGQRKLFDPSNDDPLVRPGQQWPGAPSAVNQSQTYDARAHGLRPRGDARRRDARPAGTGRERWRPAIQARSQADTNESNRNASNVRNSAPNSALVLQPDTRPISQEQLVEEVKGIYVGLVMVEAKCVEVVSKQVAAAAEMGKQPKLNNEQWQALIALHRTLLYEHHDFFLASQHPAASPTLRRLANRYAMPARMWRHGIHSFLELLRRRLPGSLDHMLAFIYLAYSMMSLLYETVPAFEETWIECLGDLGRYRMAIEDDDIRDRDVWANVSRFWYSKAADKNPTVGRLYHHLAILARPNALEQLCYYCRSLTCVQPFSNARESILTLFDPFSKGKESPFYRQLHLEKHFIKAHGILFGDVEFTGFEEDAKEYLAHLSKHIDSASGKWKEQGVYICIANIAALFEYGMPESPLRRAFDQYRMAMKVAAGGQEDAADLYGVEPDLLASVTLGVGPEKQAALESSRPQQKQRDGVLQNVGLTQPPPRSHKALQHACYITFRTLASVLQRSEDPNVLEYVHVCMVFLWSAARVQKAIELIEGEIPWDAIANYLNNLATPGLISSRILNGQFPQPENPEEKPRPLKEDFSICGQVWSQDYFPDCWFSSAMIDDEERSLELPSMAEPRRERVLWLGARIASHGRWLHFDGSTGKFFATQSTADAVDQPERGPMEPRDFTPPTDEDEDDADDEREGIDDVHMSGTIQVESVRTPSMVSKPDSRDDSEDIDFEKLLSTQGSFGFESGDGMLRELRLTSSPPGEA